MVEDHLDKETSFGVALTQNGVEAKAKSRTLAALDRLGGNIFEWGNVLLEKGTSRRRATIEGEAKIIEATAARAVELIGSDDAFAARALASQFGDGARKQLNRDAVFDATIDDLQNNPPTQSQSITGPDALSEEFFTSFENYASSASTEQLRERWGRVLASEIRQPGKFSRAVLRVIDEIDQNTASTFESICRHRIDNYLPRALTGVLDFQATRPLVESGLIFDPGLGQVNTFHKISLTDGRPVWFLALGRNAIAFDQSKSTSSDIDNSLSFNNGELALPIYVLTSVGLAVSSILEDYTADAIDRLIAKVREQHDDTVTFYRQSETGPFTQKSGSFAATPSL